MRGRFTTWEMVSFSKNTVLNGVSITQRARANVKPSVLYARIHAIILSENLGANKNNKLQFSWKQNYIKCWFAKRQEKITGFSSNTKEYFYMTEQSLCVNP